MHCRMLMLWCATTGLKLCDASFVGLLDAGDRAPPLPSTYVLLAGAEECEVQHDCHHVFR